MKIAFIGLGNVGGKLAGSLLRNGFELTVRDLDAAAVAVLADAGAKVGESPQAMAAAADAVITCLPSPVISATVLEADDGVLAGLAHGGAGKLWLEMSTTDADEVRRLGEKVQAAGAQALDAPVSGGCHRAASGNISIFVGGARDAFEQALPLLRVMGQRVLHTGALGSASVLKVVTNYLATANLASVCEALVTAKAAGMDLNTTFEAIRISSGNSFVHETESQVILNGSRDINFTMDLVQKDLGLFNAIAERAGVALELAPLLAGIFEDGAQQYGAREFSPNIIRRLEDACGIAVRAHGFPAQIVDDEAEAPGYEVEVNRGDA